MLAMQESEEAECHVVTSKAARKAVQQSFAATDKAVLAACRQKGWGDGAVCVAVWVLADSAVVGNIGKPDRCPFSVRDSVLVPVRRCSAKRTALEVDRIVAGGVLCCPSVKHSEAMQHPTAAAPAAVTL